MRIIEEFSNDQHVFLQQLTKMGTHVKTSTVFACLFTILCSRYSVIKLLKQLISPLTEQALYILMRGRACSRLYNYLKPYPQDLRKQFYEIYGGEKTFSNVMASAVLGYFNSGMQLYWVKYKKPHVFKAIKHSLHLPQYMSYLLQAFFTRNEARVKAVNLSVKNKLVMCISR